MTQTKLHFPQDAIWQHATQMTLKLMLSAEKKWYLTFSVEGLIGPNPFEDDDEDEAAGGLLQERAVCDPAAVVQSIVSELIGRKDDASDGDF